MSQPMVEQLVAAGVAALRAGERERARQLLGDAVRADPRSPEAWLYLAGAVTDAEQRRQCLERVLALSPGHSVALKGLASLAPLPPATPAPPAALPVQTRQLPVDESPVAMPDTARPALPVAPSAAGLLPAAGGSLLGRLVPPAITRTTAVVPDPDAPGQSEGLATGDTTPLLTLPVESAVLSRTNDPRFWFTVVALGIILLLVSLALLVVVLV